MISAFPRTNDPSAPLGHLPFREDYCILPEGEVAAKPTEGSPRLGVTLPPQPQRFISGLQRRRGESARPFGTLGQHGIKRCHIALERIEPR